MAGEGKQRGEVELLVIRGIIGVIKLKPPFQIERGIGVIVLLCALEHFFFGILV